MKLQETEVESTVVSSWSDYTPDQLRVLACEMERDKILSVSFRSEEDYGGGHKFVCYATRMETEAEAVTRERKENEARKQREMWDRANYERLRKQFEK